MVSQEASYSEKIAALDKISTKFSDDLPDPVSELEMVVIIPAKDEEENICSTLASIAAQQNHAGLPLDSSIFEIIVLCHSCSDSTYEKAHSFSLSHPKLHLHLIKLDADIADNVGSARRVLMNVACDRLSNSDGLIVSTDADTCPDPMWLVNLRKHKTTDTALVCGLIEVDTSNLNHQAQTYLEAKDRYMVLKTKLECDICPDPHDTWPRHSYHWGPNLAIKKYAYQHVGGMMPLHFLEDVDLFNKVVCSGYKIRHCMRSKVTTSTRIDSRCNEGFGAELKVWTDWQGVEYNVEGLQKLRKRFEIYSLIKSLYDTARTEIFDQLSRLAFIDVDHLELMHLHSPIDSAMIIQMDNHLRQSKSWNDHYPNIGVLQACDQLASYLSWDDSLMDEIFSQSSKV